MVSKIVTREMLYASHQGQSGPPRARSHLVHEALRRKITKEASNTRKFPEGSLHYSIRAPTSLFRVK